MQKEARYNARKNMRSAVADCLNPVRGYRDAQRRRGIEPKDFAKEYRETLSNISKKNRTNRSIAKQEKQVKSKLSPTQKIPNRFVLKKFRNVQSRFRQDATEEEDDIDEEQTAFPAGSDDTENNGSKTVQSTLKRALTPGSQRKKHAYLRKRSSESGKVQVTKPGQATPRKFLRDPLGGEKRKQAVPKRTELGKLAPRNETNFIAENFKDAVQIKSGSNKENNDAKQKSLHAPGSIPKYLLQRKIELRKQEEEKRKQVLNKECPPGMKLLEEPERLATLELLQKSLREVKGELDAMPLSISTPGQIRRKNVADTKLKEIEDAIRIFSKKKVFIKLDQ